MSGSLSVFHGEKSMDMEINICLSDSADVTRPSLLQSPGEIGDRPCPHKGLSAGCNWASSGWCFSVIFSNLSLDRLLESLLGTTGWDAHPMSLTGIVVLVVVPLSWSSPGDDECCCESIIDDDESFSEPELVLERNCGWKPVLVIFVLLFSFFTAADLLLLALMTSWGLFVEDDCCCSTLSGTLQLLSCWNVCWWLHFMAWQGGLLLRSLLEGLASSLQISRNKVFRSSMYFLLPTTGGCCHSVVVSLLLHPKDLYPTGSWHLEETSSPSVFLDVSWPLPLPLPWLLTS